MQTKGCRPPPANEAVESDLPILIGRDRRAAKISLLIKVSVISSVTFPRMFTENFRTFDHEPEDAELVTLLGPHVLTTALQVIDNPNELIIRPRMIPMWFAVPWVLLIAGVITALIWFVPATRATMDHSTAVLVTVTLWAMILPALFAIFAWINKTFRQQGNYCRVDKRNRTLTARFVDRPMTRDQILCIIDLERHYVSHGVWDSIRQASVLYQNGDGAIQQYPLATEIEGQLFAPDYGGRIATALDVPVRRIRLSKRESKAIGDHPDD